MATKGVNPFAAFKKRKFGDDVETKGELKKFGKEGSKSEEAHDKTEKFARGGGVGKQVPAVDPRAAALMAARMRAAQQAPQAQDVPAAVPGMKKGGGVKKYAKGGGVELRGKTRGKIC